jgi:hypothetical protein
MDVKDQIEEMLGDIQAEISTKEEEVFGETAAPTQEEGKADEPKEGTAQAQKAGEEVPAETTGEPVDATPAEEPAREPIKEGDEESAPVPSTATSEDPQIAAMRETINRLSQQLLQSGGLPAAPTEAPKPAVQPMAPQPSVEVDLSKFQVLPEGVDFEDVVNSKEHFEKFMRDLLARFNVVRVRQDALAIPMMVSRQVQSLNALQDTVRTFYDSNKDLVAFKPLVGAYCNRIVAEHPDWNMIQVLEESARQSRASIGAGMKAAAPATPAAPAKPAQPVKPSFATTTATRNAPAKPNESKLAKDVSDLISGY